MMFDNPEQFVNKTSGILQKFLPMLPGQDSNMVSEIITQKMGDIVKDIEQASTEQLQKQFEDAGAQLTSPDSTIANNIEQAASSHDGDISDILGDESTGDTTTPESIANTPDTENLGDSALDESTDEQNIPADYNPFPNFENEQPRSQRTHANPFTSSASMNKMHRENTEHSPDEAAHTDTAHPPENQLKKQAQIQKLQQSKQAAVRKASEPYQKKLKNIKKELADIDSDQRNLKIKMGLSTAWFGVKMTIGAIVLIVGAILTIIILTAFLGVPMMAYAGEMMLSSFASYSVAIAEYTKQYAENRAKAKKHEADKKIQQKKIQEVQAQANKSFGARIARLQS